METMKFLRKNKKIPKNKPKLKGKKINYDTLDPSSKKGEFFVFLNPEKLKEMQKLNENDNN